MNTQILDILTTRPSDYGAALIENPAFAKNICSDLETTHKNINQEKYWVAARNAALIGTLLAASVFTGPAAVTIGLAVTGIELKLFMDAEKKFQNLSNAQSSELLSFLSQGGQVDSTIAQETIERIDALTKRKEKYTVYKYLILGGFATLPTHAAAAGSQLIVKVSNNAAVMARVKKLEKVTQYFKATPEISRKIIKAAKGKITPKQALVVYTLGKTLGSALYICGQGLCAKGAAIIHKSGHFVHQSHHVERAAAGVEYLDLLQSLDLDYNDIVNVVQELENES